MKEKRFSMAGAIRFGWDTMKSNIGFFILLIIVALLIEKTPGMIGNFAKDIPLLSFLLFLTGGFLGVVVQMGFIRVSLKFCDGTKGNLDDLLSTFHLLWKFIACSIIYSIIFFGLIFLVVIFGVVLTVQFSSGPASFRLFFGLSLVLVVLSAVWMMKFSLFPYFIVDRGLGPVRALKGSSRATVDAKLDLFLFGLLLGLINIAGFLLLVVGLFATIPTSMLAYAYVYRTLSGTGGSPEEGSRESSGGGPATCPEYLTEKETPYSILYP